MPFYATAKADEVSEVSKLLRGGQLTEALSKAEAFLMKRPRDAQMRFLKGVILTEENRSTEAVSIFTKLTEDYPDLPEPYNNLAVLYASSGQFEKARAALDMAIRTNPTYATAYENLGDIHAKLASQAYDKALQLDSSNSAAKSKLTLVKTLSGSLSGAAISRQAAAANIVATNNKVAATTPPASTGDTSTNSTLKNSPETPTSVAAKPAAISQHTVESPPISAKTERSNSDQVPPVDVNSSNRESDEILKTVNGWAKAWSNKDVKSYLAFYSNEFQPPNNLSRKAWADERQSRIEGKGRIDVKVTSPQVTISADSTAIVRFRQLYISDRLKADSRKSLHLIKQAGKWQIKQERTGN